MSRIARYAAVALILGLAVVLTLAFGRDPRDIRTGTVGKPAPGFALPSLTDGTTVSLDRYKGKIVVLNFWASWCVDCKLEARTLHDAAAKWGKDVVFVGVDTKDFASAARSYMRRYDINYHVVRDVDGSAGDRWGVTGYPETFFVDRQGRVIPPHVNGPIPVSELDDSIRKALRS
jgi:cytochrome c biogenesis protein CcmG, thiol:disulfide interchange protein DsbE